MRREPIEGNWLQLLEGSVKRNWNAAHAQLEVYTDNRDKNTGERRVNGLTNWQKRIMGAQYGK